MVYTGNAMTHFDPNDFPIETEPPRTGPLRKRKKLPHGKGLLICGTIMAKTNALTPKTRLPHDMDDDPEYLKMLAWARTCGCVTPRVVSDAFGIKGERLNDVMEQLYRDGIKSCSS